MFSDAGDAAASDVECGSVEHGDVERGHVVEDVFVDDEVGEDDDGTRPTIALPALARHAKRTEQSGRTAGTFACRDCWQPVFTDGVNPNETWNLFVTHMSGGLLTGHDVPRPRGVAERGRRHFLRTVAVAITTDSRYGFFWLILHLSPCVILVQAKPGTVAR